jgi:hypothetical protein
MSRPRRLPVIEFLCGADDRGIIAETVPARSAVPEWFRRSPASTATGRQRPTTTSPASAAGRLRRIVDRLDHAAGRDRSSADRRRRQACGEAGREFRPDTSIASTRPRPTEKRPDGLPPGSARSVGLPVAASRAHGRQCVCPVGSTVVSLTPLPRVALGAPDRVGGGGDDVGVVRDAVDSGTVLTVASACVSAVAGASVSLARVDQHARSGELELLAVLPGGRGLDPRSLTDFADLDGREAQMLSGRVARMRTLSSKASRDPSGTAVGGVHDFADVRVSCSPNGITSTGVS